MNAHDRHVRHYFIERMKRKKAKRMVDEKTILEKKYITFDESAKLFILEAFDKAVDAAGFVVYKDTLKVVKDIDGIELKFEDFAGIAKGPNDEDLFFTNNLTSLIQLADMMASPVAYVMEEGKDDKENKEG